MKQYWFLLAEKSEVRVFVLQINFFNSYLLKYFHSDKTTYYSYWKLSDLLNNKMMKFLDFSTNQNAANFELSIQVLVLIYCIYLLGLKFSL